MSDEYFDLSGKGGQTFVYQEGDLTFTAEHKAGTTIAELSLSGEVAIDIARLMAQGPERTKEETNKEVNDFVDRAFDAYEKWAREEGDN